MKPFFCSCGNNLFFENSFCLKCQKDVGYDPASDKMRQLDAGFRRCGNGVQYGACNWLLPAQGTDILCLACQLNQIIPDLTLTVNVDLWKKMERAKRRAVYSLLQLGLPVQTKAVAGPQGLAFYFLRPDVAPVLTGHEGGVITINVEEADDSLRERNRNQLGEPYRTLLGHFRHELAHFYWSLWFELAPDRQEVLPALRSLFGNDTMNYQQAMQNYYQGGPQPNWQSFFVSAYASMHPWEDWAETWAHYLHVTDAVETAHLFGLEVDGRGQPDNLQPGSDEPLPPPFTGPPDAGFMNMLRSWLRISPALNEISSSLGRDILYPFALTAPVVRKLRFVHAMIERQRHKAEAAAKPPATPPPLPQKRR